MNLAYCMPRAYALNYNHNYNLWSIFRRINQFNSIQRPEPDQRSPAGHEEPGGSLRSEDQGARCGQPEPAGEGPRHGWQPQREAGQAGADGQHSHEQDQ